MAIHARIRSIWTDMHRRCYNPKRPDFKWYGARGIKVCDAWKDRSAFQDWALANGYEDSLTLDRKDTDSGYSPSNCRWTTIKQQERNRRNNNRVTHNGETRCLSEWAELIGISKDTLWMRLYTHKWPVAKALSTPLR